MQVLSSSKLRLPCVAAASRFTSWRRISDPCIAGFDMLIVHPTATMHLSINIIRLSNVHMGGILKLSRGDDGISSDKCKGKADRGDQRFCLIRALKGFDDAFPKYVRTCDAEPPWDDPNVIRQTIFSIERLESHARSLARAQVIRPHRQKGRPLLDRLADNETSLLLSYQSICGAVSVGAAITPAAEWLIDNFHQVERQVREIRTDLPAGYYRQLPKLADGPFARYPRVFEIAWAYVAHTDSRFDVDLWCGFLRAYQEVQYLTIGELWASAITLRLVLIENLRRIADRVVYRGTNAAKLTSWLTVYSASMSAVPRRRRRLKRSWSIRSWPTHLWFNSSTGCEIEARPLNPPHPDRQFVDRKRKNRGDSVRDEQERQVAATRPSATSSQVCVTCPTWIGRKFSNVSTSWMTY